MHFALVIVFQIFKVMPHDGSLMNYLKKGERVREVE
jgi:hypothetical protein